ncbi:MAG TPA: SpoIIE family protein phosphatase [Candidatus Mcinerneyibacterium sp.]|nr:SpoIIE family protein phosphatase [Candidatus Mcinerneyibacterium sp.]
MISKNKLFLLICILFFIFQIVYSLSEYKIDKKIEENYKLYKAGNVIKAQKEFVSILELAIENNYYKGVYRSIKYLLINNYNFNEIDKYVDKSLLLLEKSPLIEEYIEILYYKVAILSHDKKSINRREDLLQKANELSKKINKEQLILLGEIFNLKDVNMDNYENIYNLAKNIDKKYTGFKAYFLNRIREYFYKKKEFDQENKFIDDLVLLAKQDNNIFLQARMLLQKSIVLFEQGNILESIESYKTTLDLINQTDVIDVKLTILNNLGYSYKNIGDMYSALNTYLDALKIIKIEQQNNKRPITYLLDNIGEVYYEIGNYEDAIKYFTKSIEMSKEIKNEHILAASTMNLSRVYLEKNSENLFITTINKAEQLAKKDQMFDDILVAVYLTKAKYYRHKDNEEKEFESLNRAYQKIDSSKLMKNTTAKIYYEYGNMYYDNSYLSRAIYYYKNSLSILEQLNEKFMIISVFKALGESYSKLSNYEKANYYFVNYIKYKEYQDKIISKTSKVQLKHKIADKEKEIALLEKDQQIKMMNLQRQKIILIILSFVIIVILVLVYFILKQKRKVENLLEVINKELNIAKKIQKSIIPHNLPKLKNIKIDTKYLPMENVGGDFYDFHVIDKNKFGVLISDVSGHGIPAALIASMVKIAFSTLSKYAEEPRVLVQKLNEILYDKIKGRFITAGYILVDLEKNKVVYASAGHPPIYIYNSSTDKLGEFIARGMLIGYKDINLDQYEEVSIPIKKGDKILLYTDGIIEAINENMELFGEERMKSIIISDSNENISNILNDIYESLLNWVRTKNNKIIVNDDITLIGIEIE